MCFNAALPDGVPTYSTYKVEFIEYSERVRFGNAKVIEIGANSEICLDRNNHEKLV